MLLVVIYFNLAFFLLNLISFLIIDFLLHNFKSESRVLACSLISAFVKPLKLFIVICMLFDTFVSLKMVYNVRVYDHLRCQSDSVSRYTDATQSDAARNLMPSN
jgi:hypothetical protein